jgi:two-component system cell cycle sensor histidine kinase/response regulator CckA
MFFNKPPKSLFSWVEALDEPAFVFTEDGAPAGDNAFAREMMADGRLPFSDCPALHIFVQNIDALLPIDGTTEFVLAGKLYDYDSRNFKDGTLIRFRPLRERDHILRISTSLDNMPWGILTLDVSGEFPVVVYTNRTASDLISLHTPAKTRENGIELLRSFGIDEDLSASIHGHKVSYHVFEKINSKGLASWYRLHFIPYRQGRSYCLIVVEDMTEAKKHEGQYLQSQRLEALGQLAGGVAHDFNNILSIIDGYARLVRKIIQESPDAEDCLDRITLAVERASAITSKLLTFGSHKVKHGEIHDLGKIVEEQRTLLGPLLDASINLIVKTEFDLWVEAAPDQICQILINLCINARDAMPSGGDLIVETGRRGETMSYLRVIDMGMGMSADVKAKIFDPFFTTKDQGKGTGLGLSVVYGLVKDMRGEIDVLTEEGAGTSMTVWLPSVQENVKTFDDVVEDESSMAFEGKVIMVVEDEPDLLSILITTLENTGMKVVSAKNGKAALEIQKEYNGTIDFLLTDVVMPEMNGVKLSSLFRVDRPETKIVFMSGYPAGGHMGRVPLPKHAVLIPKPIKVESLLNVLQKIANAPPPPDDEENEGPPREHWRIA